MAAHCYAFVSAQKLHAKAFKYVSDALVYGARLSVTVLKLKINNCEGKTAKAIARRSSLCTVQITNHSNLCHMPTWMDLPVKVIANRSKFCTVW